MNVTPEQLNKCIDSTVGERLFTSLLVDDQYLDELFERVIPGVPVKVFLESNELYKKVIRLDIGGKFIRITLSEDSWTYPDKEWWPISEIVQVYPVKVQKKVSKVVVVEEEVTEYKE